MKGTAWFDYIDFAAFILRDEYREVGGFTDSSGGCAPTWCKIQLCLME